MTRPLANRRGFTLIELLVVISVLAVLISLLMPALAHARAQAKSVLCQSNLHQYGLAGQMYLQDNDGRFGFPYDWLYNPRAVPNPNCAWHDVRNNYDVNPGLSHAVFLDGHVQAVSPDQTFDLSWPKQEKLNPSSDLSIIRNTQPDRRGLQSGG